MALHFKPDISLTGLTSEALFAILVVHDCHSGLGVDCWVSGATEPGHLSAKKGGKHPLGLAVDFGVAHLPVNLRSQLFGEIKQRLAPLYQALFERPTPEKPKVVSHYHVEYHPGR